MARKRKRLKKVVVKKKSVLEIKYILASIIIALDTVAVLLLFKVGEALWPDWLRDYQTVFIVIPLFITVFIIVLSPIIIAFTNDPRPLPYLTRGRY
jgi:hypothetical protein